MSTDTEDRIKKLEMDVAWLQKDIKNLISIIENAKVENHTHYYIDNRTFMITEDEYLESEDEEDDDEWL